MQRSKRWLGAVIQVAALLWATGSAAQAAEPIQITDLRGQRVTLAHAAQRIVFSATDDYGILAMIDPEPAKRIVAWNKWRLDADVLAALRAPDPAAFDRITQLSIDGPQNLHAEALIAMNPDLVVLDTFYGKADRAIARLEKAGIAVAVLNLAPDLRAEHPTEGIEKIAVLVGRAEEGKRLSRFMLERLERVQRRVAALKAQGARLPKVLMEPHAGSGPCCMSMGAGKNLGDLVRIAGGELIGAELILGMAGQLNAEYVIAQDPDVYIGTGGGHLKARGGLLLGPGISEQAARDSLQRAAQRKGLSETSAVRHQRVYGIMHSGLSIAMLEKIARWLHPDTFRDLEPQATLDAIHQDWMKINMPGLTWIELGAGARP